jgi:Uncharacterised nucleotidyltransferase
VEDEYSRIARTLCWACTGRMAPVDCPEDLLLPAIAAHRISARFLARVAGSGGCVPERMVEEVKKAKQEELSAAEKIEEDTNWVAETITGHPKWDGAPLLAIKGNASSYLTGISESRRGTADLDLLTRDPELCQSILEAAGYRSRGDNFGGHEAANLYSASRCEVDLHLYCPSWRLPSGPYSRRTADGQELLMTEWIHGDWLDYDTVLEDSIPHPVIPHPWLRIPGTTTSMLIICLEIFRDYLVNNQEVAVVRLSDLCEVVELRNANGFDVERFMGLVDLCNAQDCVTFTSYAVDQLFGREDVLRLGIIGKPYPQMIGIGQLFDTCPHLFDLLVRRDNFGNALQDMRSNELLPSQHPSVVRVHADGVTVDRLPAYAVRSVPPAHAGDKDVEFDCTLTSADSGITLDIRGLFPPGPFREVVKIVLRHTTIVTGYDGYRSGVRNPNPTADCSVTWQVRIDGWSVRIDLAASAIRAHRTSADTIPMIIHCCRFLEPPSDSWDDYYRKVVSSVSVPVVLRCSQQR